ncbi:MAG: hypothetical protein R2788_04295 [Saprospiraceae bacterium]
MLLIYAPIKHHEQINEFIAKEDRLDELVKVIDYLEKRPIPSANNLLVKKEEIWPLIDWYNLQPPFLLPENIPFNEANFLGIIFSKLQNYEKAHFYLSKNNPTLFLELDFINRLQQGLTINPDELVSQYSPFEEYRLMHNQAILRHYASTSANFDLDKTIYFYGEALQSAPNEEYRAFTLRHLALLLMDIGKTEKAIPLLKATLEHDISKEAKTEIKHTLCQAWMQILSVPYDVELLEKLKITLWEVLQEYEKQERSTDVAMLLTDAGIITNYSESWSESLGYFNRAISIFENENLPELAANAQYRKGILLFTWAKNGNPQFFRTAAECFQKTTSIYNRNNALEVYADIQHHLGMIYAEIPDEIKKKGIWAAVSSSAFQEALEIYSKETHPYEYAAVCNHYGNALVNYPEAKLSDNYEKAIFYYQEALDIRTPEKYPMERCLTILNYLEAQWHLGMPEDKFDENRYLDMIQKAEEVKFLSGDDNLKIEAEKQLEKLAQLKMAYA